MAKIKIKYIITFKAAGDGDEDESLEMKTEGSKNKSGR